MTTVPASLYSAILAISVVFAAQVNAQQDSLTLDRAVEIVLERNASIRQAEEALAAAREHTGVLKGADYPSVNLIATDMYIGPEYPFSFGNQKLNMYPVNAFDAHVGADYTAYDFGKRRAAVETGREGEATAADRLESVKKELSFQVRQVFMSIILQEKSLYVADSGIAELGRHLEAVKKKIETGSATEFEALKTQVQLAGAWSVHTDITNDLNKKRTILCQLLGLAPDARISLQGTIDSLPPHCNADSLYRAALANRSDYALTLHAKRSAELQLKNAKLENLPVFGLRASAGFKNGLPNDKMPPDINTPRVNWSAGAVISVPIYDGMRSIQHEKEMERLYNAANAGVADKEERIKTEILQAKADVEATFSKLDLSRTQVLFAGQSLELARLRYDAGVITNLDVLDAENDCLQAHLGHLQNQFRYVLSVYELDRVTGK